MHNWVAFFKNKFLVAQSLTSKIVELRALINKWEYDIVAFTVIWLNDGQDWQLNVTRFRIFRHNQRDMREDIHRYLKAGMYVMDKGNISVLHD